MKRVIRSGLFETNSSSVHSMIMCSKEEYEKLVNYELLIKNEKIVPIPECEVSNVDFEKAEEEYYSLWSRDGEWDSLTETQKRGLAIASKMGLESFASYGDDYEFFDQSYKTASGEEVVAFGYCGWDG